MTPEEIIYHRRLRVMEHARRTSVSDVRGVSHDVLPVGSTSRGARARGVDAQGVSAPGDAQCHTELGCRRYADDLGRRGFQISPSGAQKILNRHGLGRRRTRVTALAQLTAATSGLLADPAFDGPFGFCHFAAR